MAIRYFAVRLAQAPLVLLTLVTVSFFLIRFAPGGPFSGEKRLDPSVERALAEKYRLDRPLPVQYLLFCRDLLNGDLGPSLKHKERTVNEIIATALPNSIILGALALAVALSIGGVAGIGAALRQNSSLDYGLMAAAVVGISLPTFVIGPLLQLLFAIHWRWFPLAGFDGITAPRYLVLPALTLGLPFAARVARLTRAGMLDVLKQDFIRTARSKGLRERTVVFRHALRGGLLPVVSFLGPAVAQITTGSLVVETIFQIPGLGREFVESALSRDYTLVIGTVVVYGSFIIICNLVADISYGILDPRVRYGR